MRAEGLPSGVAVARQTAFGSFGSDFVASAIQASKRAIGSSAVLSMRKSRVTKRAAGPPCPTAGGVPPPLPVRNKLVPVTHVRRAPRRRPHRYAHGGQAGPHHGRGE